MLKSYIYRPKFELFNLKNDPHEINNLAKQPEYRKILDEMTAKIIDFQKKTKDPWLSKWEYE